MSWYDHFRALMDASINRSEQEMHKVASALHDEFEKIFGNHASPAPAPAAVTEAPATEAAAPAPAAPEGESQQ